jgi:hypothetical protein
MIVRALDINGDWEFGKGKNDYKRNIKAVTQNIKTRLMSFLGDCFFDTTAGIDWFNLLGGKDALALELAVTSVILNTETVTGLLTLSVSISENRRISLNYRVQTTLGETGEAFQYDVNGIV